MLTEDTRKELVPGYCYYIVTGDNINRMQYIREYESDGSYTHVFITGVDKTEIHIVMPMVFEVRGNADYDLRRRIKSDIAHLEAKLGDCV